MSNQYITSESPYAAALPNALRSARDDQLLQALQALVRVAEHNARNVELLAQSVARLVLLVEVEAARHEVRK